VGWIDAEQFETVQNKERWFWNKYKVSLDYEKLLFRQEGFMDLMKNTVHFLS